MSSSEKVVGYIVLGEFDIVIGNRELEYSPEDAVAMLDVKSLETDISNLRVMKLIQVGGVTTEGLKFVKSSRKSD